LKQIIKCNSSDRNILIQQASPDQIRALTEIAYNIVQGKFSLPHETLNKLKTHKLHIRKLSKKTVSHKDKKKLLVQKGGFLPLLVTPILSVLGAIAGKVISSQLGF
jgi:hypothetical protein